MSHSLSLKKQLEAANTGDVIITEQHRTGVYVAAKRAGVKVSTKDLPSGHVEITILGELTEPKSVTETIVDLLKDCSAANRLIIFEQFELCCGMNRGECVCEPKEYIDEDVPRSSPSLLPSVRFEQGYQPSGVMNPAIGKPLTRSEPVPDEPGEDEWRFTRDKARQDEQNGNWYRPQFLASNPRKTRVVRVDEEDHDEILSVNKKR